MPDVVLARYKRKKGDELHAYCHFPVCGGFLGRFGLIADTDIMCFWLPPHFMLTTDCEWVDARRAKNHDGAKAGDCNRALDLNDPVDRQLAEELFPHLKTPSGDFHLRQPDRPLTIERRLVPLSRLPARVICPNEGRHLNLIEASALALLGNRRGG